MERIECEVGESAEGLAGVRAAIARCRESGAELELVGVVRTSGLDAPQPAVGERVRRFKHVQRRLGEAVALARAAGLNPTVSIRHAEPERRPVPPDGRARPIAARPARLEPGR